MIEVIPIGAKVKFTSCQEGEPVTAEVIGITIRCHNKVQYELVWWCDRDRREVFVHENEIAQSCNMSKLKIGFANK